MKDFTPTQKLLMACALFAAVTFAVLMAYPGGSAARPAAPTQAGGMMTPF
jgi:hypothetical protein